MRDVALALIVLAGCLYALRYPWFGAILWTWVSVMNPHMQTYGFMRSAPIALAVVLFTIIGLVTSREKRNPFIDGSVWLLAAFVAWISLLFPFSLHVEESKEMFVKVLKIDFMILVTIALLIKKEQIIWFVSTIAFSLAYYGVKGGIFTVLTGGGERVWGPGGFIGGNNEVALAFITVIPLMYFLYMIATNKWIRRLLLVSMLLTAGAAIGSQSRGALVGIVTMGLFLWYRSDRKIPIGIGLVAFGALMLAFMPESWFDRMNTIKTYEEDGSAMGRINAWIMCWNLALARPIGGGFAIYEYDTFALYAPDPNDIHAAHSIYFQVLGEQGWIGFLIWIAMWIYVWRGASWLRKHGALRPDTMWCSTLGAMCQVSIVGFATGGAFLSLAYFDLPYNILVVVVCAKKWLMSTNAVDLAGESGRRGSQAMSASL